MLVDHINQIIGKPLFEMCCFHMGIARKGGGGVEACQDGLGHFFSTFARLTEGGESKAIWAMPIHYCFGSL